MNDTRTGAERTAAWMAGDRLSSVLHLGDSALAYTLADQGHDVTIAGDDARVIRHSDVHYVRTHGERLPFAPDSFDVVVVPNLDDVPTALGEFARVLRRDGLLSTVSRTHDATIPWVRRLRDLVGERPAHLPRAATFTASGLFSEPESSEFGTWDELDLAGLLAFAESTRSPDVSPEVMHQVRALFAEYSSGAGFLRVRHQTHCVRARVQKDLLPPSETPPDPLLLDFH